MILILNKEDTGDKNKIIEWMKDYDILLVKHINIIIKNYITIKNNLKVEIINNKIYI
jgi:hypothetical protein